MYRRNTSSWLKHWDFILLDSLLFQLAFFIANILRNGFQNMYDDAVYRNTAIIIGLLNLVIGFFMESYKGILRRGYGREFSAVVKHVVMVFGGIIIYLFTLKISADMSRLAMLYFPFLSIALIYSGRILRKLYLKKYKGNAYGTRAILLICGADNYKELVNTFLDNPYSQFKVAGVGIINDDIAAEDHYRDVIILNDENTILDYIQTAWVDEVMFCIPQGEKFPDMLIQKCNMMGITAHIRLEKRENSYAHQTIGKIEGHTVISNSISIASSKQLFYKRTMDIIGSIAGLLLTGILFIGIAPIIYIKSPGPVFFSQWRVGKNGRRFRIHKFRSMYMDAEERKKELMEQNNIKDGMMFKMDNDPRIIKGIGNFIRNYSLDEFPQFWNVLKGDMSLVGTRPPTVDEWEKYEYHHRKRMVIKPGLTGMWQISGRSDITDFEEVVRLDTEYIQNWNIWMDIKIILKTILVVLEKKGSK